MTRRILQTTASVRLPRRYRIRIAPPVYLSHRSSLAHDPGPHPEQPARIVAIERELASQGWLGMERVDSSPAEISQLHAVHEASYVSDIERLCAAGGGAIDADTAVSRGSWEAALHSAGGAVELVDRLLGGASPSGFSGHRPPGHHADAARAMGFCLFNNAAVAAAHARAAHGLERVLVLDWDVHHGNGTNDIFHADSSVLYASIHQYPLYPGTGPASDVGAGPGAGYTLNLPVPAGSGDAQFASLVEHVVVPVGRAYAPQLVLVSAGYDAHLEDPLADCRVTEVGYAAMTRSMLGLCRELDVPLGVLLEGGYALDALARSVVATLQVLIESSPTQSDRFAPDPLAARARARLAEPWGLNGL